MGTTPSIGQWVDNTGAVPMWTWTSHWYQGVGIRYWISLVSRWIGTKNTDVTPCHSKTRHSKTLHFCEMGLDFLMNNIQPDIFGLVCRGNLMVSLGTTPHAGWGVTTRILPFLGSGNPVNLKLHFWRLHPGSRVDANNICNINYNIKYCRFRLVTKRYPHLQLSDIHY